ncbi:MULTISPECIES: hypothetical protein [Myxococcus]|nr:MULTISPECIES: hypothetical protein [Myxococcus]NVJ20929.1 hypothetical protein [Myxococcus sp. AM011]
MALLTLNVPCTLFEHPLMNKAAGVALAVLNPKSAGGIWSGDDNRHFQ